MEDPVLKTHHSQHTVLACFLLVDKHHDPKCLCEGNGSLAFRSTSQSTIEGSQGRNLSRHGSSDCGRMQLTALLPMACSSCFLTPPRTTRAGVVVPTVARKCPTDMPMGNTTETIPQARFLFADDAILCQDNKKQKPKHSNQHSCITRPPRMHPLHVSISAYMCIHIQHT